MGKIHYIISTLASETAGKAILKLDRSVVGVKCHGTGVKCHGTGVGPKGNITLITIATWDGEVYIFDVKINPDLMYNGGLIRLLQSADLIKVFHDCSIDGANLSGQFGVQLRNVYDTQLAYSVIMEEGGLPPRRLSLPALCDKYKISRYTPSQELQRLLNEDLNVWARRPVTRDMLNTTAADAIPLVPALYVNLNSSLPEDKWEWFCHLCDQNSLSLLPSKKYAKRPKTGLSPLELPVYTLADWQEKALRESCSEQ